MNKFKDLVETNLFQYNTIIENVNASIIIDLGVESLAPVKELPFLFSFKVLANEIMENRFPTAEESEVLYNIGDEVDAELKKINSLFAGCLLCDGIREIFYYVDNTVDFKEIIDKIMESYSTHKYKCGVVEDENWELYLNALMPNDYEYQAGLDGTLIYKLETQGDDIESPRDIDFYIYFENKLDAETVLSVLEENEYRCEITKNEDGIYGVSAVKNMPVYPNIYSSTELFVSLALKHNGNFDGWGCASVSDVKQKI